MAETTELYSTETWIDDAVLDAIECGIQELFLDFLAVLLVELQEVGFWDSDSRYLEKIKAHAGTGGDMTFVLLNGFRDAVVFLGSSQISELTPGQARVLRRKGIRADGLLLALKIRRELVDLIGYGEEMSATTKAASETADELATLRAVMVRALTATSNNLYPNQAAQQWKLCQNGFYYADGTERGVSHPWNLEGTMKMPFFIGLRCQYDEFVWACSATLEELQAIRLELEPDEVEGRKLNYDLGFDAVVDDTFIDFLDGSTKSCKVAVTDPIASMAFAEFLARELLAKQSWSDGNCYVIEYGPETAMGATLREHLSKEVLESLAQCSKKIRDSKQVSEVRVLADQISPLLSQANCGPVTGFRRLTCELIDSLAG